MKISYTIFLVVFTLFNACGVDDLTLPKKEYTGNEVKLDGYYYTASQAAEYKTVLFFFRNGVVNHPGDFYLSDYPT